MDIAASANTIRVVQAVQVEACHTKLGARLGDLGTFAPTAVVPRDKMTTVLGTVDKLEKPPTARPGEMAPLHMIVTRYQFRCRLSDGIVKHIWVHRARG